MRELTGKEPKQKLWARVQDAVAALTGVVGSVVTRTDDEMSIRELLLMDHTKVDILFMEIFKVNTSLKKSKSILGNTKTSKFMVQPKNKGASQQFVCITNTPRKYTLKPTK